jgi:hypothetical protein
MKSGSHTSAPKEHTVKKRAYIVVLAVLVALMAVSGASAKKTQRHSVGKVAAKHSVSKAAAKHGISKAAARKSVSKKMLRRAGRSNF